MLDGFESVNMDYVDEEGVGRSGCVKPTRSCLPSLPRSGIIRVIPSNYARPGNGHGLNRILDRNVPAWPDSVSFSPAIHRYGGQ